MKKLMIAAAAAAMIGGAEATVTNVYDFVANLQTTTGALAQGYDYWTSDFANLGKDVNQVFWYKDVAFIGTAPRYRDATVNVAADGTYSWTQSARRTYPNLAWEMHSPDGIHSIPTLVITSADGTLNRNETTLLTNLRGQYNRMSAGAWCCQLVWQIKNTVNGGCFRAAGANYISQEIELVEDCCGAGVAAFTLADGTVVMPWILLNRFGDIQSDRATQLEFYSPVGSVLTGYGDLPFWGYLAGQGYWQEMDGKRVPMNISGSIVGQTTPSLCEYCCWDPDPTLAFECLDDRASSTPFTAAFGTFYIQWKGSKQ